MRFDTYTTWLLTSPGHWLISRRILLMHVTGTRTGRLYHVPVNYLRHGDTLYILSYRCRGWWRNLRGEQALSVHLRGKNVAGHAQVTEDEYEVMRILEALMKDHPLLTQTYRIFERENGTLSPADLRATAKKLVVIRVRLSPQGYLTRKPLFS